MAGRSAFGGRVTALSSDARHIARLDQLAKAAIASRLKALMAERGLSVPQLAETSRVNVNSIYGAVNGETAPSLGKIVAFAAAMNVSIDQLFADVAARRLIDDSERARASEAS